MDTKSVHKFVWRITLFLLFITISITSTFGFDSGISGSCSQKMSRQGRAQYLKSIPCDLTKQSYCNLPGSSYPWHAVRRFVHENQGLMKRMYGDVHHISVLRNEIQKNDLDLDEFEIKTTMNYFTDGDKIDDAENYMKNEHNENVRLSKYLHSLDFQNSKLSQYGIPQPHFRPATPVGSNSNVENKLTKISGASFNESKKYNNHAPENEKFLKYNQMQKNEQTSNIGLLNIDLKNESDNEESNDVYETDNEIQEKKNAIKSLAITKVDNDNVHSNISNDITNPSIIKMQNKEVNKIENKSEDNTTISATLNIVKQIVDTEIKTGTNSLYKTNDEKIQSKQNFKENSTNLTNLLLEKFQLKFSLTSPAFETSTMQTIFLKSNQTIDVDSQTTKYESVTDLNDLKLKENENFKTKNGTNKTQLLEGQLFQDTVQKDPPNLTNLRGVNACPTKEEVVAPFWANNTRGEVLALLNLYPFEQYVHWERCTNEHKQMYCREGCRCEQQYSLHRLLAYDPHDECRGIFSDWFRFPSCCICKCYNIPIEVRTTSRSPRSDGDLYENKMRLIDRAEAEAHRAIYNHAIEDWYRPNDNLD